MENENRTKPTSDSQEKNPNEDIQHQHKVLSEEKVKDCLHTTPCDATDASPETSGGATSTDLDVERVSSASSQSRSITSRSSRSSSKRSSATVKAALANSVWSKLKNGLKKNFAKKQSYKKLRNLKKAFGKKAKSVKRRGRQTEDFEERCRRHAEELQKHRCLIEKRR